MIHDLHTNHADTRAEPPMNTTPQRKRWVAAASCVGLVAVIAGGGYWSNYVYLSDLTALDAWNRYMDLIKDGKYDEALKYSPDLLTNFDGRYSTAFLTDAAHAHAPSTVTFEGEVLYEIGRYDRSTWIDGTTRFDDGTTSRRPFTTCLDSTSRRNGRLGMWEIDGSSFGSTVDSIDTDGLRSIRIGAVSVDNPQGSYYLFPGSYRVEAVPQNPDYWTITYKRPLGDGAGELRTKTPSLPFTIEPSDKLKKWIQTESEAFAASCRTGTPDPARQRTCGALAFSTEPLDLVNDPPFIGPLENSRFTLIVGTGPTDPNAGKKLPRATSYECRIDFAYDGATPTLECTLDK